MRLKIGMRIQGHIAYKESIKVFFVCKKNKQLNALLSSIHGKMTEYYRLINQFNSKETVC